MCVKCVFVAHTHSSPVGPDVTDDTCVNIAGTRPFRSNYDSFWEAFVTAFQMTIFDNWTGIVYPLMLYTSDWAIVRIPCDDGRERRSVS